MRVPCAPEGEDDGGKKLARLTIASLAAHAQSAEGASASPRSVACCLDCRRNPSSTINFPLHVRDCCLEHWDTYLAGFTMFGTFASLMKKVGEDPSVQADWEEAKGVAAKKSKGTLPDWFPSGVFDEEGLIS